MFDTLKNGRHRDTLDTFQILFKHIVGIADIVDIIRSRLRIIEAKFKMCLSVLITCVVMFQRNIVLMLPSKIIVFHFGAN